MRGAMALPPISSPVSSPDHAPPPAPSDAAFVSVVVPHYNDPAGLARCIDALMHQTFPADRFEVVVADNRSEMGLDAVVAAVAAMPGTGGRVRVVDAPEQGAGPARNAGVAASRGAILAFTDSDCVPVAGWLAAGVAGVDDATVVGGKVRVLVDDPARRTPVEAFETVFAFRFDQYIAKKGFTGSGNLFCTRRLFDRVGGFGNGLSEDVDWSHRARAAGARIVYVEAAEIGHPARRTWAELARKWDRITRETYLLHAERGQGGRFVLRTLALPLSIVAHVPRVLTHPDLSGLGERIGALGVLVRSRLSRTLDGLRLALGGR